MKPKFSSIVHLFNSEEHPYFVQDSSTHHSDRSNLPVQTYLHVYLTNLLPCQVRVHHQNPLQPSQNCGSQSSQRTA